MKLTFYFLLLLALLAQNFVKAAEAEDGDAEVTTEEDAEKSTEVGAEGEGTGEESEEAKNLELDDKLLWETMDVDKDGKLTVADYEKFSTSPQAIQFIRLMKEKRAIGEWAKKLGVDTDKARELMWVGANAAHRQNTMRVSQDARIEAERRRQAIMRRNQQINQARQQQQNYWSRLGQMYYKAMQRRGGRTEL